jgi:hypothetical protein
MVMMMASERVKKQVEIFLRGWRGEWDREEQERINPKCNQQYYCSGPSFLGGQAVQKPEKKEKRK